mmetsp:Transcript_151514/g.385176  ORF Transcript_151514/g.385176 Transcript_151514/m.385176 type:complete len:765 (+) Transcript_151514:39-2333(+)
MHSRLGELVLSMCAGFPDQFAVRLHFHVVVCLLCTQAIAAAACSNRRINVKGLDAVLLSGHAGEISPDGESVMLRHNNFASLVSSCEAPEHDPEHIKQLSLLGATISFTADLSRVGCACNLAVYLVSAPARAVSGKPNPGRGDYYCDANKVGGQWCPEVDLMEANNHAFQATPHKCDVPAGDHHYNNCDRGGCAQNTRDIGKAYGVGKEFTIDTRHPFRVSTTFEAQGQTLTGFKTVLSQEGRKVVLEHANCDMGYLAQLSKPVQEGMSLIFSYWGASAQTMAWMDSPPCGPEVCQASSGHGIISGLSVHRASATPLHATPHTGRPLAHQRHVGPPPTTITVSTTLDQDLMVLRTRLGPIKWSSHPNTCLTVEASALLTTACDRKDTKQVFQSLGDGKIRWFANPRFCVSVAEDLNQNGASVILSECQRGNSTLTFSFPWDDTKIHWAKHPSMCLDVTDHRTALGTPIQMWTCLSDDDDQIFVWPQLRNTTSPDSAGTSTGEKTTTLVPALYDCLSMDSTWRPWTSMKKAWCCQFKGIGCEHETTQPLPFDCSFGYPDWVSAWSRQKRTWCCQHQHLACSPELATTTPQMPANQFDCFSFLQSGWSRMHRSWCCEHEQVACEDGEQSEQPAQASRLAHVDQGSLPYDCMWGYDDWPHLWSATQAEWCCKRTGRGCQDHSAELPSQSQSTEHSIVGVHVANARFQKLDGESVPLERQTAFADTNPHSQLPSIVGVVCMIALVAAIVSMLRWRCFQQDQAGLALIQ